MSADGDWKTTSTRRWACRRARSTIKTDGATFTGTDGRPQGTQEISGKVDGDTLTWSAKITQPFPMTLEFTVTVERRHHDRHGQGRRVRLLAAEGRAGLSAAPAHRRSLSAWKAGRRAARGGGRREPGHRRAPAARGGRGGEPRRHPRRSAPAARTPRREARLEGFLERRARREPVSQILGRKGFWKMMLRVDARRADAAARDRDPARRRAAAASAGARRSACSTWASAPARSCWRSWPSGRAPRGLGVDVSEEALAVARDNAAQLGLAGRAALLRGDWTAGLGDASFDLVVSNPPYIATAEIETLAPEVRDSRAAPGARRRRRRPRRLPPPRAGDPAAC